MIFSNILHVMLLAQLLSPVLGGPATRSQDETPDKPNRGVTGIVFDDDANADRGSGNKPTIKIKGKNKFGSDLEVTFKYSSKGRQPEKEDWVGIYRSDDLGNLFEEHQAYLYTCNSKALDNCLHMAPPKKGTLTFSVSDPESGTGQDWPLNPGKYAVCLFDYHDVAISTCKSYTIKEIDEEKLETVPVITSKNNKFDVGDSIILDYDVGSVKVRGTWIALYPEGYDEDGGLEDTNRWIYAGCNNQYGDQRSTLCDKIPRKGTISISQVSQRKFAIPAGKYYACAVFSSNPNADGRYEQYKCGSEPIIIEEAM